MHDEIVISRRNIALVAHDNKKDDLVEWADFNKGPLALARARIAKKGRAGGGKSL